MLCTTQVYRPGIGQPRQPFASGQLTLTFKADMSEAAEEAFKEKYELTDLNKMDLGRHGSYYTARFETGEDGMKETREMRLRMAKDQSVQSAELIALRYPM